MVWLAVDVALAVVGLAVLALLALRVWRQVRALSRAVGAAAEQLRAATVALDELAAVTARRRGAG